MDETLPKYSSDSYIPFSANSTDQIHAQVFSFQEKKCYKNITRTSDDVSQDVPWKTKETYSTGVVGLHEEINDFYEMICPTKEENEIRLRVIEHITKVIHSIWPHAQVDIFGSFRTGLYLPTSDIDMVITGEWINLPLNTLGVTLQQCGISESDISVIEHAKVPIIRMIHTPTRVKVDISFNMKNGVESAKLVKKLMKEYPTLPKLVLVLKQFLVQRGLNEVYNGGMSSYCLTLLIVSLLQGFHKPRTLPSSNLGTLLLEFFEHYGLNFNYEKVSIHFQDVGHYQPKFRRTGTILNIEDPLQEGNNVAKGTFLMHLLKLSFENAFYILHKAVTDSTATKEPLNSYLRLIVTVDESVYNERKWVSQNYPTILQQLSHQKNSPRLEEEETTNPTNKRYVKKKKIKWCK